MPQNYQHFGFKVPYIGMTLTPSKRKVNEPGIGRFRSFWLSEIRRRAPRASAEMIDRTMWAEVLQICDKGWNNPKKQIMTAGRLKSHPTS